MLKQGQVLNNRYQIHAVPGQGGFGAAYKGWYDTLHRHCAIKENLQVSAYAAYAERFEAFYYSAFEHVERLTPSLLAKAFRGELVGQEQG